MHLITFHRETDLGLSVALDVRESLREAWVQGQPWTLGLPSGRSCLPVLRILQTLSDVRWDALRLLMPDAYCQSTDSGFSSFPQEAHFSVFRFVQENVPAFPFTLGDSHMSSRLLIPDPERSQEFENLIPDDGVDLMLLASGSGDGHVAFNGPGSPANSTTRVVELPDSTRRDNLRTYPKFGDLASVPRYGVTIGIETIARTARRATLVLPGAEKSLALTRVMGVTEYDPEWPASVIHNCNNSRVYTDAAAGMAAAKLRSTS